MLIAKFILGAAVACAVIVYALRPRAENRDSAIIDKINREMEKRRGKNAQ